MNILNVGDIFTTVEQSTPQFRRMLKLLLRARPTGYQHSPKFRAGFWDGYVSLYEKDRFPTGVLPSVLESEHPCDVMYTSTPVTPIVDPSLHAITLRDYQASAVHLLLNSPFSRGIAKMATNSGKTEVMASVIKNLQHPPTLVFVHRKELLHQTAKRFQDRLQIPVGVVGDGITNIQNVTVCMIQSAGRLPKTVVESNKLLMVDECHTASSTTTLDVLQTVRGSYRFGFSGTPLNRGELADLKLIAFTGPVVVDISNEYLIDRGFSAKPQITIHTIQSDKEHLWKLDYQEAYEHLIVTNSPRNSQILKICQNLKDSVVLVLVSRILHGELLQELIPNSVFISGTHSTEYRQRALEIMKTSSAGVFIATTIFDEGVDVPNIDALIIAGGGKSEGRLLQRIGRGLRTKQDSNNVVRVHDFLDDTNRHLFRHSENRLKTYERENFDIDFEDTTITC